MSISDSQSHAVHQVCESRRDSSTSPPLEYLNQPLSSGRPLRRLLFRWIGSPVRIVLKHVELPDAPKRITIALCGLICNATRTVITLINVEVLPYNVHDKVWLQEYMTSLSTRLRESEETEIVNGSSVLRSGYLPSNSPSRTSTENHKEIVLKILTQSHIPCLTVLRSSIYHMVYNRTSLLVPNSNIAADETRENSTSPARTTCSNEDSSNPEDHPPTNSMGDHRTLRYPRYVWGESYGVWQDFLYLRTIIRSYVVGCACIREENKVIPGELVGKSLVEYISLRIIGLKILNRSNYYDQVECFFSQLNKGEITEDCLSELLMKAEDELTLDLVTGVTEQLGWEDEQLVLPIWMRREPDILEFNHMCPRDLKMWVHQWMQAVIGFLSILAAAFYGVLLIKRALNPLLVHTTILIVYIPIFFAVFHSILYVLTIHRRFALNFKEISLNVCWGLLTLISAWATTIVLENRMRENAIRATYIDTLTYKPQNLCYFFSRYKCSGLYGDSNEFIPTCYDGGIESPSYDTVGCYNAIFGVERSTFSIGLVSGIFITFSVALTFWVIYLS